MATENVSQPERNETPVPPPPQAAAGSYDEAIEALVYDVHPALLPPARRLADGADYPYGPRVPYDFESASEKAKSNPSVARWISNTVGEYVAILNRPPDFVVPKTFGMSAILGIMTALAILFGCLRWMNAWPVFYFFFGVQSLAICLVQMFYGQTPRLASIVAGALILPLFALVAAAFSNRPDPAIICAIVGFVPFGALLGYLTGTCAAGVFLVMDYLEPYLQGQSPLTAPRSGPIASAPSSSPAQPS